MSRSVRLFSIPALVLATAPTAFAGHAGINGASCAYNSVQAAINAAPANSTVWVAEGWNSDPGFVVNKRLILERGTATCAPGGSANAVLDFTEGGHAEVAADISAVVFDHITLHGGVGTDGGNLEIGARSDVWLDDVALWDGVASGEGGGIYLGADAYLSGDGVWFLTNSAYDGGGLYAAPGSEVSLGDSLYTDLFLSGNEATDWGGGIACVGCTLTVDGAEIEGGSATNGGGIAALTSGADLAEVTVEWSSIHDNDATYGGGMYVYTTGDVAVTQVEFTANQAVRGGALLVDDSLNTTVTDAEFTSNSSTAQGGAIYVFSSDLDVEHSRLESNSSAAGGAVYVSTEAGSDRFIHIDRSTFYDNTATAAGTGSGIDIWGSTSNVTLSNTQVVGGNSPLSPGGAVVAQGGSYLFLDDSTVAYNERYGVVTTSGATGALSGVIVWANGAGVSGGGSAYCTDVQGGALPGARNISSNPLFTDPANADLTLQSASPAKDACPPHAGISLDNHDRSSGHSDMGAYDHL